MTDLEDVVRAIEALEEHAVAILPILENIEGMLQTIVDHIESPLVTIEADGPGTINEIPDAELIDPYAD